MIATALCATTLLTASAASAAGRTIFGQQYTGTASGTDTYGLFGVAGATLSNVPYTAVYTINTELGGLSYTTGPSAGVESYGGIAYKTTAPVTAVLNVDGKSFDLGSDAYTSQAFARGGTQGLVEGVVEDGSSSTTILDELRQGRIQPAKWRRLPDHIWLLRC